MLGGDRGEVPAELFVVLKEVPQGVLLVREAGLLGVFAGQQVTEPWVHADPPAVVG